MRIAFISDTHGNLVALEAVLADIARSNVDQIIFLGDALTMGPQPKPVIDLLRSLNCSCILGNHDENLLNLDHIEDGNHADWYIDIARWTATQLDTADFDFLHSFQATLDIQLDDNAPQSTIHCFHGSPKSNRDFLLVTTTDEELAEYLGSSTATVLIGGHAHVQMIRRYGHSMLVNVGSVGFPLQHYPFSPPPPVLLWAEYAIVSWAGSLSIDLRRVDFDLDKARQLAGESGMPHRVEGGWWP
ncbi:MAG: metallophosphoesterase family protein [Chloroflexota bacterium]